MEAAIFECIEVFYNRQRKHTTLGYTSAVDYRRKIQLWQFQSNPVSGLSGEVQIENGPHWVLDVAFRKDESWVRKAEGAENPSVPRRMTLDRLGREKMEKGGMEAKRCRAGGNEKYLEKVLAGLRSWSDCPAD